MRLYWDSCECACIRICIYAQACMHGQYAADVKLTHGKLLNTLNLAALGTWKMMRHPK